MAVAMRGSVALLLLLCGICVTAETGFIVLSPPSNSFFSSPHLLHSLQQAPPLQAFAENAVNEEVFYLPSLSVIDGGPSNLRGAPAAPPSLQRLHADGRVDPIEAAFREFLEGMIADGTTPPVWEPSPIPQSNFFSMTIELTLPVEDCESQSVCAADFDKLCAYEVNEVGSEESFLYSSLVCMRRVVDSIQDPDCRQLVLTDTSVVGQCYSDILEHCAEVQPGSGRIHSCLTASRVNLSPQCAAYLTTNDEGLRLLTPEPVEGLDDEALTDNGYGTGYGTGFAEGNDEWNDYSGYEFSDDAWFDEPPPSPTAPIPETGDDAMDVYSDEFLDDDVYDDVFDALYDAYDREPEAPPSPLTSPSPLPSASSSVVDTSAVDTSVGETAPSTSPSPRAGLSSGAVAAICVGAAFATIGIILLALRSYRRSRQASRQDAMYRAMMV